MTLTLEGLAAALTYRNVLACLACVKSSESVLADDDRAYRMLFGGVLIDDLSRHPRRAIQSPWGWTSAAGAYQAMAATADGKVRTDTWGDFCRAMGTTADEMPFDAEHQDLFAVWCIRRRGALQDAIAGRFDAVVKKCSYEWASWPPGRYGQPTTTLEKLRAVYVSQGGTFADQAPETQPAAPIEDKGVPYMPDQPAASTSFDWDWLKSNGGAIATAAATIFGGPAAGAVVGSLVQAFKPVLQDKLTKEIGRHTDPATATAVGTELTRVIVDATQKVSTKTDPVEAIAEVRKDPVKLAAVEQAVEQKLVDMLPLLNEMHRQSQERFAAESTDRNDAATRVKKAGWNIQKPLVYGGIAITVFVIVFLLVALVVQIALANDHLPDPTLIAFAGPIIVMGMRGIERAFAFAFGGEISGSPAADARLTQQKTP